MKTIFKLSYVLAASLFLWISAAGQSLSDVPKSFTYAIEINGVLCGFAESGSSTEMEDGTAIFCQNDKVLVKLSVLGGGVDMNIQNRIQIDPSTQQPLLIERSINTTAEMYSKAEFHDGYVLFTDARDKQPKRVELEPDVITENTLTYPHLMRDFITGNKTEETYKVFDDTRGFVAGKTYKKLGEETLDLAGKAYQTILLEELNRTMGITSKIWLDKQSSFPLKFEIAGNRVLYLADASVKKSIRTVDMNNILLTGVDLIISNVPDIAFMKVEASIQTGGEWITAESLNFPGQKFEGTVTNNLIEGVFEVEKQYYSGENAPLFPASFSDANLQKYLEPETLIESDHPALRAEAHRITEGSEDCWEAAVKLSTWVGKNIHGAIPGGTSAINTYQTREGECGSHSRLLAAFCRAVGIPARLSIGCMYFPYQGGSFGQHAWTEVYMGEAGWKAVDATSNEYDFVDAGHIRLGEKSAFNPKSMNILEYRMGSETGTAVPHALQKYLGKYRFEERNALVEVLFRDGSLAVDIPGTPVLALNPPDENGVIYPKMTRQLSFSFEENLYGNIAKMKLQQVVPLGKKFEQDSIGAEVPEEFKLLVGNYWFAQAQADFKVFYENGVLKIEDPLAKKVISLPEKNAAGLWIDEFGKNEIAFEKNEQGEVVRMLIYSNVYMEKQVEL